MTQNSTLILFNGKLRAGDPVRDYTAVKIIGNKIAQIGSDAEILDGRETKADGLVKIDLHGRRIIPGLNDSHIHLIRGGLSYNQELRWEGIRSLADAMAMLEAQIARTPAPQWVRVVGGFTENQFKEKRLPTLDEINRIAPDTPVFILHLYDRALLNRAALRAVGYDRDTPEPPGGEICRDADGNPTVLLLARPNASILYATLAKGPRLPYADQRNSTLHFMRELNRLGVTSVIDAGGGYQNYPDDYAVINDLHASGDLTLRIAYNLFTQHAGGEVSDFERWTEMTKAGAGDDFLKVNGAGEMLVFSAADFEDFKEPRADLSASMQTDLEAVVRVLARARWPFRLHATYNETIDRALDVFEKVDRELPLSGLRWFFDHAETVDERNIERIKALGGGIAIQHRMAFQGEYFMDRYGKQMTAYAPPVRKMLQTGVPVGAGTDATRVASYNPFVALKWLVTGKTMGGTSLYGADNLLSRDEALRLYTEGSAWFSNEDNVKGRLESGYLADLAVLSQDFFAMPDDEIDSLESVLTIVDGRIVYCADEFKAFDKAVPVAKPDWSPVNLDVDKILHRERSAANLARPQHHQNCRHSFIDEVRALLQPLTGHGHGHDNAGWDEMACPCFVF